MCEDLTWHTHVCSSVHISQKILSSFVKFPERVFWRPACMWVLNFIIKTAKSTKIEPSFFFSADLRLWIVFDWSCSAIYFVDWLIALHIAKYGQTGRSTMNGSMQSDQWWEGGANLICKILLMSLTNIQGVVLQTSLKSLRHHMGNQATSNLILIFN